MSDDAKRKEARKVVRAVQHQFDRESAITQRARQEAFAKAQKEGLSLRELPRRLVGTARESRRPIKGE